MLRNPAGERNVVPIIETLKKFIDGSHPGKKMLEISSGTGLHVHHLARNYPKLSLQSSEYDTRMFASIKEYTKGFENVFEPVFIDIAQDLEAWTAKTDEKLLNTCQNYFDFILNINMIHITPFICTEMLFANSSKLLKASGLLFTYGPYSVNGILTPDSNVRFNESLQSRDPSWGVRDIGDLERVAGANGIALESVNDLPSNNKLLVWRKNEHK